MMNGLNNCNIILVENIPYGTSETRLKEIFQQVGPIASFRLVFDKENKKSTGYCYCEYHDPATSASAIRNLNNVEMEDQKLKVGYADNKSSSITNEVYKLDPSFKSSAQQLSQQQKKSLQQSSNTSDVMNKPESPSRSSGMNEEQLLDVLLTLQLYSQSTNENQARELLLQNPLLAYDLFKILFQLDLVDSNILKNIISENQPEPILTSTVTSINHQELAQHPQIQQHQVSQLLQQQQYSQQLQQQQQQQKQELEQQRHAQQLNIFPQIYQQAQLQQQQEREQQKNVQQHQYPQQYQQVQLQSLVPSSSIIAQPIQQPIQQSIQQPIQQPIQSGMMSDINYRPPIQVLPTGTNFNNAFMNDLQVEQNAALILQLLNLTPQQIEMFPADQRNRIIALQQQIFLQARRY